mmetsp:Transcript_98583/g.306730  ORF Transcript_98583/g.306730 Transcript_98583/m.306730 type:complete len:215 (-) Transcript_98583:681-1325(-)
MALLHTLQPVHDCGARVPRAPDDEGVLAASQTHDLEGMHLRHLAEGLCAALVELVHLDKGLEVAAPEGRGGLRVPGAPGSARSQVLPRRPEQRAPAAGAAGAARAAWPPAPRGRLRRGRAACTPRPRAPRHHWHHGRACCGRSHAGHDLRFHIAPFGGHEVPQSRGETHDAERLLAAKASERLAKLVPKIVGVCEPFQQPLPVLERNTQILLIR